MITTRFRPFERTSKRRKGFPSETRVKRGARTIKGGKIELLEKLGRGDPCPCGSGKRFQEMLPALGPLSTGRNGATIGALSRLAKASPFNHIGESRGKRVDLWTIMCI